MAEPVSIPLSYFEYIADFERPMFAVWLNRADLVQSVFDSLIPWNPSIENVEGVNEGKPADQGVSIRLPERKIKILLNPGRFKFNKDQADWNDAGEVTSIVETTRRATLETTGATMKRQTVVIAMHIQLKSKNFRDFLSPFIPERLRDLRDTPLSATANILRWEDAALTLDGSALVSNAIFARLELGFLPDKNFQYIAGELRRFESALLELLGLEEERP